MGNGGGTVIGFDTGGGSGFYFVTFCYIVCSSGGMIVGWLETVLQSSAVVTFSKVGWIRSPFQNFGILVSVDVFKI